MNKGKDLIVVTGATGKQGGAVARELLARKHRVRVTTRKPESEPARALAAAGAQVVRADFDDAASLERAFDGAWGVFAMQNTWEAGVEREEQQGMRMADVAKKARVSHFVYTSVGSAHRKTGIPHFENKSRIEEKIRAVGFPSFVILRPVFFMENFLAPQLLHGLAEGKLVLGIKPETALQMIAVEDVGKFGRLAFEDHARLSGRAIDLAGDQRTMPETAAILGKAMGRTVTFQRQPIEQVRAASKDYAMMLEWFDRVGYDADTAALEREYTVKLVRLPEWAAKQQWKALEVAAPAMR